jgi:hypothetical protein
MAKVASVVEGGGVRRTDLPIFVFCGSLLISSISLPFA